MAPPVDGSLPLRAGLCFITLACWLVGESVLPSDSNGSAKRWAQFELSQEDFRGNLQAGKAVTLTISLGGVTPGSLPIVALCESSLYEPQTVTLESDGDSGVLSAKITLQPVPMSRTSIDPKAARIQVTFGRLRRGRMERFMRRIVYVTLDRQEVPSDTTESPPVSPEEIAVSEIIVDEAQPDVTPVYSGDLTEEDLMPLAEPGHGKAYWKQVSYLISRSWAKQVRAVRHGPSSETVRVHFVLYPNGRAQLIEIERGSGSHDINVAGIYAIVDAQPFSPFPSELGDEVVDVHVRMRTGARGRTREVQSVKDPTKRKQDASPSASEK